MNTNNRENSFSNKHNVDAINSFEPFKIIEEDERRKGYVEMKGGHEEQSYYNNIGGSSADFMRR
jgi:stage III sporulation protein SpoIIIAA